MLFFPRLENQLLLLLDLHALPVEKTVIGHNPPNGKRLSLTGKLFVLPLPPLHFLQQLREACALFFEPAGNLRELDLGILFLHAGDLQERLKLELEFFHGLLPPIQSSQKITCLKSG